MPKLKTIYDNEADVPEAVKDYYVEKNGKWEIQAEGVKTQADIDRVQEALRKEKTDHKAVKEKLQAFGDLDPAKVPDMLSELETTKAQLEAAIADGKVDPKKNEAAIEAAVKRALGPVEREKTQLQRDLDKARNDATTWQNRSTELEGNIKMSKVEQTLRDAALNAKVLPTAVEDAVMVGMRMCELTDDGRVLTKDSGGATPGLDPNEFMKEMQEKRPHWWALSQGGNARGGNGAPVNRAENPWTKEGWNLTKQGQVFKQVGAAKAAEMAKQAGVVLGATRPAEKVA